MLAPKILAPSPLTCGPISLPLFTAVATLPHGRSRCPGRVPARPPSPTALPLTGFGPGGASNVRLLRLCARQGHAPAQARPVLRLPHLQPPSCLAAHPPITGGASIARPCGCSSTSVPRSLTARAAPTCRATGSGVRFRLTLLIPAPWCHADVASRAMLSRYLATSIVLVGMVGCALTTVITLLALARAILKNGSECLLI